MTCDRTRAHTRVMMALSDLCPSRLHPSERARIHVAADALLFCADIGRDRSASAAFSDFRTLHKQLVGSGRCAPEVAGRLADDLWGCGPGAGAPAQG